MRGGALPPALLCAALGLALAFAPRRVLPYAIAGLVLAALAFSFIPVPTAWLDGVFIGLWASLALTAASVHLPQGLGPRTAAALTLNGGLWTGLVVSASGSRWDLTEALPCSLLCLPAAWMVAKGWSVAIKVAASWLIAIALLAAGLSVVPTPGYKPDHME